MPFGGNSASRYITTYFHPTFPVANAALVTSLTLNLMRDDGAVIYLNGVAVARSNMPSGAVGFSTLASSTVGGAAETACYAITLPRGALLSGNNVLAVELHQSAANSSDLKLDAELIARP